MYQFSLKWFEDLFKIAIKSAEKPQLKNLPLRVENIKRSLLKYIYYEICRSVFVRHKQLFSFFLSITLLDVEKRLNKNLWKILLTGKSGEEVDYSNKPDEVNELLWEKVCELCSNPIFEAYKEEWLVSTLDCSTFVENMEHYDLLDFTMWPKNYIKKDDLEP